MKTFRDALGREWEIELNIGTARRIRARVKENEALDVDFLDCAGVLTRLTDVFFAADLLYEVCRDEAQSRGVDAAAFGAALKGPFLFDAITALTAEYLDFFPDPTTVEKMRAVVDKIRAANEKLCDAICGATAKALDSALRKGETRLGALLSSDSAFSDSDSAPSPK